MEKTRPATTSSRAAPCEMALRMSELMNAEQCSPNFNGEGASSAMGPISGAERMLRSPWADSSRNEPVPAEQASFMA